MGKLVRYVAQAAFDDFNQNYADNTTFFQLEDFVYRIGNVASDYYRTEWKRMYDELRAEGSKEVVAFDSMVLSEQIVKVKKNNETGEWEGAFDKPIMSLPFDLQNSGVQNIFNAKTGEEIERSNINEAWQNKYQPYNNRMFFRVGKGTVTVFTKGNCNLQEIRILYVPSITIGDGDEELPDGIVSYCTVNTVAYMRGMQQGKIIKKSLDNNQNMVMETEMNKESLK